MNKFLATLAVLTAISTPVFAQSFDPEVGTGNVLPLAHKSTATQAGKTAASQQALRSFANVPHSDSIANPNDPAATGGGSVGYNEMLRNSY